MKKTFYQFKHFEEDVKKIAKYVNGTGRVYRDIYPVPRGGFFLALRLSHLLGLPIIANPIYISKDKTIIVDDVCDTGKTLRLYRDFNIVCLHWKPHASFKPWFYCRKTDKYVVYFWEKDGIPLPEERSEKIRKGVDK